MRISKLYLPAVRVAGALALAGCGGGGDSMDDMGDTTTTTTPTTPTTPAARPATLTGTGLTNSGGTAYDIRLEKDETYDTPNGGTITCPTNECVITVGAQRGTPNVTATGGATFAAKAVVRAPGGGRDAGENQASAEWLSDRNLLNAVKVNGATVTGITITDSRGLEHDLIQDAADRTSIDDGDGTSLVSSGGAFNGDDAITPTSGSKIGRVVIEASQGDDTTLRLIHTRGRTVTGADDNFRDRDTTLSDYLVFGTWLTVTGADGGPQNVPRSEMLVAGSLPVDTADLPTTGDARYEGKAIGHYKVDNVAPTASWSEWDGTVALNANFSRGTSAISGSVNTGITYTHNNEDVTLAAIGLGRHEIGQSGKVSGVGSGTWEAGFYGTPINGAPNGIAGSFRTERAADKRTGSEVRNVGTEDVPREVTVPVDVVVSPALIVQGAFGAHHVGQIEDDEQQGGN